MTRLGAQILLTWLTFAALPCGFTGEEAWAETRRWYVGEKVVCINNGFLYLSDAPELSQGAVYTVRQILPPQRGYFGLAVDETDAKPAFHAFDERRFRPFFGYASLKRVPAATPRGTAGS